MADPIPRPTEENWRAAGEPDDGLPRILYVIIVSVASILIWHFVTRPAVRRFATYYDAVTAGMATGAERALSPLVPESATNIVHGADVSVRGGRNYHWIVVTVPEGVTAGLLGGLDPLSLDAARGGRTVEPMAALREWPPELRTPAAQPRAGFALYYDRDRRECIASAPNGRQWYLWRPCA